MCDSRSGTFRAVGLVMLLLSIRSICISLIPTVLSSFHRHRSMVANGSFCQRLVDVPGLDGRKNDIIFAAPLKRNDGPSSSKDRKLDNLVVYFCGDIQDYRERMEKHRDNRRYAAERNLETTVCALAKKFPSAFILAVKPQRMYLGSFACYSNFLQCNDVGAPGEYPPADHRAWEHLKSLLDAVAALVKFPSGFSDCPVSMIGFSKGAVVLNQLVYELKYVASGSIADRMANRIRDWYWLDGAHAGSKRTWITDEKDLEPLVNRAKINHARIHVHVTPRQVRDPTRPWVGEEEGKFSRILERRLVGLFIRKLHFENEPPSVENHFRVLDVFEPDADL